MEVCANNNKSIICRVICWIAFICKQSSSSVSCCSLLPRENKGAICKAKELSSTRKKCCCKFTLTGFYNYMLSCIKAMLGWDSAQDSTRCVWLRFNVDLDKKQSKREKKEKERKDPWGLTASFIKIIWAHFTLQYSAHPPGSAVTPAVTSSLEQDVYL